MIITAFVSNAQIKNDSINNKKENLLLNTFPMYQPNADKKAALSEEYLTAKMYNDAKRNQKNDTIKPKQLDEVVVTAQFSPQLEKNAMYKVNVIAAKTIQLKGVNTISDLLQQELNISVSQASIFGSSIDINGVSKENIKILIDGIPVIGRLNGIIDLNQFNINNVERIEIIKGPVSVFYGTDAMGGVVNIITKTNLSKAFEGKVSSYYESINSLNLNANIGFKIKQSDIRINGGNYHFFGLNTAETARSKNWNERNQYFGGLQFVHNFDPLKLVFSTNISRETMQTKGDIVAKTVGTTTTRSLTDVDYFTTRKDFNITIKGTVLNNKHLDISSAYSNYTRFNESFKVDMNTYIPTQIATNTRELNEEKFTLAFLKFQFGKNDTSKLNYAIGNEFNIDNAWGERIVDKQKSQTTTGLYASVNYKITDAIEIQPAARYTWNSVFGTHISPTINAKYNFGNSNFRIGFSKGFRAPTIKELYLNFVTPGPGGVIYTISGNENLDVEKSNNLTASYTFETNFGNKKSIQIEPSFFYNDITNMISLSEIVANRRNYININNFKSIGYGTDIKLKLSENFNLKTGFTYIVRYNKYSETLDTNAYTYSPEISGSIDYFYTKIKTNFAIFYKYTGKLPGFFLDTTNNLVETTRTDFSNLDISATRSNFTLGVKNILNVQNIETTKQSGAAHTTDMQLWGRSLFAKYVLYL